MSTLTRSPSPAQHGEFISKQISRLLAHPCLSIGARRPGRSKATFLHRAGGLSPSWPKLDALAIKVFRTIFSSGRKRFQDGGEFTLTDLWV